MRTKLTVSVVILVFAAAALVAALVLAIAERRMQETIGNQQLALLASATAHLDANIESKQSQLRLLAQSLDPVPAPAQLQGLLERHPELRDEFFDVIIFDRDGTLIADLRDRRSLGNRRVAGRPYLQETVRLREGVISPPLRSALSGRPVVLLTQPVTGDDGAVVYILVGSIDLEQPRFFGQISQLTAEQHGYLFALTRDGLILHHADHERLLHNVLTEPGGPIPATRRAMQGWEGWTVARDKRGVESLISYRRMRTTDWVIGAVLPATAAFSSIDTARQRGWIWTSAVAALAGVAGWFLMRRLLAPLDTLRRRVHQVEAGQASIQAFDFDRADEVGALARAFHSLSRQREAAERQLLELSRTDALTGLGNRRRFEQDLVGAIERACRSQRGLAIAFLDLDHFKQINDIHGHDAGDAVLQEFAQRLRGSIRACDQAYRLAGDEFVLIFEGLDDPDGIQVVAQKIVECARAPLEIGGQLVRFTTSVGICLSGCERLPAGDVLKRADAALYQAKRAGRDRYVLEHAA